MIFLWGRRNKVLEAYADENYKCENCNSNNLIYTVTQNYFHFFWIPLVPVNKFVGTYCPDCLESKKVVYGQTSARLERQTRTPVYMYSLLILIGGLVLYGGVNSFTYSKKQKELIKNPILEDVYTFKFKDEKDQDAYSFIKVVAVSADSIFFVQANGYYNRNISYLQSNVRFLMETIGKSRNELINMQKSNIITEIYRSKHSQKDE